MKCAAEHFVQHLQRRIVGRRAHRGDAADAKLGLRRAGLVDDDERAALVVLGGIVGVRCAATGAALTSRPTRARPAPAARARRSRRRRRARRCPDGTTAARTSAGRLADPLASTPRCRSTVRRTDAPDRRARARTRRPRARRHLARLDDAAEPRLALRARSRRRETSGCCAMSASSASASGTCATARRRAASSRRAGSAPRSPRRAARARRRSAATSRDVVPSSSIAAAKSATPGSAGIARRQSRIDDELRADDRQRRALQVKHREAVRELERQRHGQRAARARGPAFGGALRHGSSALIDSVPRAAAICGAGTDPASSFLSPRTAKTTTRASLRKCARSDALHVVGRDARDSARCPSAGSRDRRGSGCSVEPIGAAADPPSFCRLW